MRTGVVVNGSYIVYTLKYLRQHYPESVVNQIIEISPETAQHTYQTALVGAMVPVEDVGELLDAILKVLGSGNPEINYQLGIEIYKMAFSTVYKVLMKFGSPSFFLEKTGYYWSKFISHGRLKVTEKSPGRIVVQLSDFPYRHSEYCAQRLRGGFQGLLELCGCEIQRAKHTACTISGAPNCEWEYLWRLKEK